jgi:hypothetical protein
MFELIVTRCRRTCKCQIRLGDSWFLPGVPSYHMWHGGGEDLQETGFQGWSLAQQHKGRIAVSVFLAAGEYYHLAAEDGIHRV